MPLHKNLTGSELHFPLGRASEGALNLDDDQANAYQIKQGSENLLNIATTNSAEAMTLGNATTNPDLYVPGTGNVGLGTSNPQKKVHIQNGDLVMHNDASQAVTVTFARDNTGGSFGASNKIYQFETAADFSETRLQVGTAGSTSDALVIDSAGAMRIAAEVATPTTPASGEGGFVYVKSDGKLYFVSDSTAEVDLTAAGSASAQPVLVEVHNDSGAQIDKGKAVYVSGEHASGLPTIALADADGSGTMPAIGLVYADIADGADGNVVAVGPISGLDTSSFSVGDKLYVSETAGALTATRPTAAADKVQNIGFVTRDHPSLGSIAVIGSGRANDIPNDLVDLTGVSLGATDLGTFTGSTITDNSSMKTAFQELETSLETKVSNPLGAELNAGGYHIKFNADTGIKDEAGNESLLFAKTTSAVNHFAMINAATGGEATTTTSTAPILRAIGTDTNVDLALEGQGTGTVTIRSRGTNSGTLTLNDEANNYAVNIKAPAADDWSASYTLTLPVDDGTANQVLKTDGSGVLSWVDQASGGGGLTVETKTTTATLTGSSKFIKADTSGGAFTITLPTASGISGEGFVIKDIGNAATNAITIATTGSETIDGSTADLIVNVNYASVELISDGTNYWIR